MPFKCKNRNFFPRTSCTRRWVIPAPFCHRCNLATRAEWLSSGVRGHRVRTSKRCPSDVPLNVERYSCRYRAKKRHLCATTSSDPARREVVEAVADSSKDRFYYNIYFMASLYCEKFVFDLYTFVVLWKQFTGRSWHSKRNLLFSKRCILLFFCNVPEDHLLKCKLFCPRLFLNWIGKAYDSDSTQSHPERSRSHSGSRISCLFLPFVCLIFKSVIWS